MLRRRPKTQPTEPAPELIRFDRAAERLQRHGGSVTDATVADLRRAVVEAIDDRARLQDTIDDLDPARAAAELKAALRTRLDPTADDSPKIAALRRRHDLANQLLNRRDDVDGRIERSLVDLETVLAQAAVASVAGDADGDQVVADLLGQLKADTDALNEAHRELDRL